MPVDNVDKIVHNLLFLVYICFVIVDNFLTKIIGRTYNQRKLYIHCQFKPYTLLNFVLMYICELLSFSWTVKLWWGALPPTKAHNIYTHVNKHRSFLLDFARPSTERSRPHPTKGTPHKNEL